MFCLLAVLLYIIAAQEECFDHQPLSQRTSLHSGDKDGFFFFFYKQCHLDRITRLVLRIFSRSHSTSLCFEHFHVVCHVKVSVNDTAPLLEKKEIYSFASSTRRDTERSMMKELKGPLSSSQTRHSPQWPLAKNKKYLLSTVLLFWARCPD